MRRCYFGIVIAGLFLLTMSGPADASLKSRIQKKLESNEGGSQNVQYQPYYEPQTVADWNAPVQGLVEQEPVEERLQAARRKSPACPSVIADKIGAPTANFIVYNVSYTSTLEDHVVTVNGEVILEVFDHPYLKRAEIPLVSNQVGLIDVQVNRGKSFVMSRGGKYYLIIDRPGRYTLHMEYLLKAKRERENGPGSFHVDVMPAPISQFEFIVPKEEVQVFIEPAIKVETEYKDNQTSAWAVMPNTGAVDVRWTRALPKTAIEKVELEPKVYADTAIFAEIGGGVIQARAGIQYSILQAEVSQFRLALPADVTVLSVNSKEMRDWKISKADGVQYLDVFLNFGTRGKHQIEVAFEKNLDEGLAATDMPWIRAVGVERENGFYGIAASTNLEIKEEAVERVTRIDARQLPPFIWQQASRPVLLAYKYLNPPFSIDIAMTRHEEIPVLVAAIDNASPETLLTKDGKALTKLNFHVRNNVKQYLRVKLPASATVWSSFVNGEPVKPAKDKDGNILISLKKSGRGSGETTQFPVEIVYLDEASKVAGTGQIKLDLPSVDLPVNQMDWRVYLPDDFMYFAEKSDGEITPPGTRLRRGRGGHLAGRAMMSREVAASRSDVVMEQMSFKSMASMSDESWGQKTKGLLPIKVDLPRRGEAFTVSKMLVVEGDQPWMSVNYVSWGRSARGWVKFGKIAVIVVIVTWLIMKFLRRKRKGKSE